VTTILRVGQVIDATGQAPLRDGEIVIDGGRVRSIGPAGSFRAGAADEVREHPGATALPGLIDSHVHLTFNAGASHDEVRGCLAAETDAQLFIRALRNARAHLEGGVTALRDCGGRGMVTVAVRDAVRDRALGFPRIAACGPALTTRGGHLHYLGCVVEGVGEVRAAARRVLDGGADFVKICATGGIMTAESDPLRTQYSPEELRAAVEEAAARSTLVAAHALCREGVERCIAAGVRSIEHCLWQTGPGEYDFDPAGAARMREQGITAGLTFAAISQAGYWAARGAAPTPDLGPWQARIANRFRAERQMVDAGVPYTVHSDAGVRDTPFGRFWVCLAAMAHELELAPMDVIRAATTSPARLLGWEQEIGTLQPGKRADILVVDGDPLAGLEALAQVREVYLDGQVVAGATDASPPPAIPSG
jgi:imidazolonepropionase-like amidohydrolase